MASRDRSREIHRQARELMPGGVNSPVRAFKAVGGEPAIIARGAGASIWDADGNEYVDYVGSWGPLILGHAHPAVVRAVQQTAERGTSFGATTELEVDLARLVCGAVPSIEQVRFVNSGTEATMSALRVARAFTGRDKVLKFEGCYHGHSDGLLAKAGSGVATLGLPDSAGVPASFTAETLLAPYNDRAALERIFDERGSEIAALIVEAVPANMGVVLPAEGFMRVMRDVTAAHGALLIFDEVITGFRLAYGGAQELYGVLPDLTCLGKVIGGGLPVGAYGGRRDIMSIVAPEGPVYQAGTLSGNPMAMAAGIATLQLLAEDGVYRRLDEMGATLADGLRDAARTAECAVTVTRIGSMMTVFFTTETPVDYTSAKRADAGRYGRFHRAMLDAGFYLPPAQFEAMFVSLAHTPADLARTIDAARAAFEAAR
ncbi:MAG: glutamate-1-semialdehyde-2,1-aminomutase [Dehalococcoidia bacterium]|nr:MAG: glutamate-1-semialdehyde-2,1-aminomutase [Dehalococcoidia bacterium]